MTAGDRRRRRRLPLLAELGVLVVVALGLSLIVRANVAQAFSIPSASMAPQLEVGDRVLVSRTAYRLHDPNRGDIVVFDSPSSVPDDSPFFERVAKDALESVGLRDPGDDELIKRVVGLPGETIWAEDGHVVVDGRVVEEPYLSEGTTTGDFPPVEISEGQLFVMGDNRGDSADSRVIGPVPVDSVVGRAVARIWPPSRVAFL